MVCLVEYEAGEELSRDVVMKIAYEIKDNLGPAPSKSWCHTFLKRYPRVADWLRRSRELSESAVVEMPDMIPVRKKEISQLMIMIEAVVAGEGGGETVDDIRAVTAEWLARAPIEKIKIGTHYIHGLPKD